MSRPVNIEPKGAHYVYTNTRSCPTRFSKLTRLLKSWVQELSNGIWHSYIGLSYTVGKLLNSSFQCRYQGRYSKSCPPNFGQWAPLEPVLGGTFTCGSPLGMPWCPWDFSLWLKRTVTFGVVAALHYIPNSVSRVHKFSYSSWHSHVVVCSQSLAALLSQNFSNMARFVVFFSISQFSMVISFVHSNFENTKNYDKFCHFTNIMT